MCLTISNTIETKRDGGKLTKRQIDFFVQGVTDDSWQDHQISAMLMAIFIQGLDDDETAHLTLAMAASGEQMDLSVLGSKTADKHSTGGVADTTTLIAAPLAAACGVPILKMSGRGLGFTGGTIDKLESIPGFKVDLTPDQAITQVKNIGLAVMSQSDSLTPADKKLYALRDVTATINSIPLIAASIMSKKIAAGADAIILDVKCGNGAFMRTLADARKLADTMVRIGKNVGRNTSAIISSMDQPLGSHIGNSLEVIEAIEVLKGNIRGELLDVALELASRMLILTGHSSSHEEALNKLKLALRQHTGLALLGDMIKAQGGDRSVIDNYSLFPQPNYTYELMSNQDGYISEIMTADVGRAFVTAGGGRTKKNELIDYSAGIVMDVRLGSKVKTGDRLAMIQAEDEVKAKLAKSILQDALIISSKKPASRSVMIDSTNYSL